MDLTWILGRAKTCFYHSADPISLTTKSGKETNLSEVCKSVTPPCWLHPLLFNGHLQTCWTVAKEADIPVYYKRKLFEVEDSTFAGSFAVDFVAEPFTKEDDTLPPRTVYFTEEEFDGIASLDSKPMLVTLHGLSGGSHEFYLRHVLAPLFKQNGGWEACVVNSRGCAMSKITTGVIYNARSTWDLRQTVKWLKKTFPNRPLFGIGFSLGANILTNYLGEEGSDCVFKAAVLCSNPWNLETGSVALQSSWLSREVYSKTMANNMKRLIQRHGEIISATTKIDMEQLKKVNYLFEFDRVCQCPSWGYPTIGAYYRDASSSDSLLAVKIPTFAIHAADDPIAVEKALPYDEFKANPYTVLCTTSTGGHLAWFERGGGRWFVKPITGFLNKMAQELEMESSEDDLDRSTNGTDKAHRISNKFDFDPMRRRLRPGDSHVTK